ncbi:MAG: sulfate/molybdate ABC transporter ATP-binding protein [Actinomycetota bacterium]
MSLTADLTIRAGALDLAVDLRVPAGGAVAILGPNGAGKTTVLRALAGLQPLARGRIELDGETLEDSDAGISVPTERRSVGFVFPDLRLFPHLDVRDNVAFGMRARGTGRSEARKRADAWLDRLGLAELADRSPAALSGGEAQRVALARTLATEPALLLLDEPLSAVDASTRPATRAVLRAALTDGPAVRVIVTHDPVDAAALADRILVLEAGRIIQTGTLAEITAQPHSPFVADLAGINLLRGEAEGDLVRLDGGGQLAAPGAGRGPVFAVFHPRSVALHRSPPEGSPRNAWATRVETVEPLGDRVRVRLAGPPAVVAEVTMAAVTELGLAPGSRVWAAVKATEVRVSSA